MAVYITIACFVCYLLGYFIYAKFLARHVYSLDRLTTTPAHFFRDDIDYLPTNRFVLFGHHFASITGLAPMLGPAVAVIWGWLPAMLWVVFGAILVGCVHDFSALVVSVRAKGMSIGKVAEGIIGKRAQTLFHIVIFFGVALAMGVFVLILARLFAITELWNPMQPLADPTSFPTAVLPSGLLVILAMLMGVLVYRLNFSMFFVTTICFFLMLGGVWAGMEWPLLGLPRELWPKPAEWTYYLLGYAFLASVLPVWSLLQSRDFLNSLLLYLGLGMAYLGFFVWQPEFAAPMFNPQPADAPSFFPFVFIVIACGAASGFHALVSSGTTAKQLDRETDAPFVGYGGMIGESSLGLLAVLACTAGIVAAGEYSPQTLWQEHYASWAKASQLEAQIGTFITGTAHFIEKIGFINFQTATALVAVVVVSFALTTLDSATRLLRYNIAEISETLHMNFLGNRFVASALACGAIGFFAFYEMHDKPAGLALWTLFGTTNQLLAALTLLTVTMYLYQRGRNPWFTGVPMLFMFASTLTAMGSNLKDFWGQWETGGDILFIVGSILLLLAIWLGIEAVITFFRSQQKGTTTSLQVELE